MSKILCTIYIALLVIYIIPNEDCNETVEKKETENCINNVATTSDKFFSSNNLQSDNKTARKKRYETWESCKTYNVSATVLTGIKEITNYERKIINKRKENFLRTKSIQTFQQTSEGVNKTESVYFGFSEKERRDGFKITTPRENPYSVLLLIYIPAKLTSAVCSGTLLTFQWVLTAAHCFANEKDPSRPLDCITSKVVVYAGGKSTAELTGGNLARGSQKSSCTSALTHPKSKMGKSKVQYDVALVRLKDKFHRSKTVQFIKLSREPWEFGDSKTCKVTAFGAVQHGESNPEDNTRKTHILEMEKPCQCFTGIDFMVCARVKEDFGVCHGDSGGGLICEGELRAVVSGGVTMNDMDRCDAVEHARCGSGTTISVFLLVYPYLGWIYQHVPLDNDGSRGPGSRDRPGAPDKDDYDRWRRKGGGVVNRPFTLLGFNLYYACPCILFLFIN